MDLSRRTLLTGTAVAAAGPALARDDAPPAVLVSTWDFGAPANAAGHAVRLAGGSALDMVEAGARVAEAEALMQAHNGYIALGAPVRWSLVSRRLTGFTPSPRARRDSTRSTCGCGR